jgi:hypothetical protein
MLCGKVGWKDFARAKCAVPPQEAQVLYTTGTQGHILEVCQGGLPELRLQSQEVPGHVLKEKEGKLAPGYFLSTPPRGNHSEPGSWTERKVPSGREPMKSSAFKGQSLSGLLSLLGFGFH